MADRISIGSSSVRSEYLIDLKRAYKEKRLVLFLGAGVSLPYGIPTWNDLVTGMLISSSEEKYVDFFPAYRPALASWLSNELGFPPMHLARIIRYQIENHYNLSDEEQNADVYRRMVQNELYRTCLSLDNNNTTLSAISRIVKKNWNKKKKAFPAIISFNFDDLLERILTKDGIKAVPIYNENKVVVQSDEIPIIHVNGYIPSGGSELDSPLIFTEDEFNKLTFSQLHWAVSELTYYLRHYTVLFIGLSMDDPNLRRLLDGTCIKGEIKHYLLRKDLADLSDSQLASARQEIEKKASHQRSTTDDDRIKTDQSLDDAIRTMVKQAHSYHRKLFKDMGVGTLWLNSYDDISEILDRITKI